LAAVLLALSPGASGADPSAGAAKELQAKIDAIKKNAAAAPGAAPRTTEIEVSENELASYVLFELRDDIPVQLDSIVVGLTAGSIGADARLNLPEPTGTALIDTIIGGRHNLFVKGKLSGSGGHGKFELEEVRVDGLPVPKLLVEALVSRFVTPKYPQVDLKKGFDLPWAIQRLTIEPHKARIAY
jgi:hypothetical protein